MHTFTIRSPGNVLNCPCASLRCLFLLVGVLPSLLTAVPQQTQKGSKTEARSFQSGKPKKKVLVGPIRLHALLKEEFRDRPQALPAEIDLKNKTVKSALNRLALYLIDPVFDATERNPSLPTLVCSPRLSFKLPGNRKNSPEPFRVSVESLYVKDVRKDEHGKVVTLRFFFKTSPFSLGYLNNNRQAEIRTDGFGFEVDVHWSAQGDMAISSVRRNLPYRLSQ